MENYNNTLISLIVNNNACVRGRYFPMTEIYNEKWMLRLVLSKLTNSNKLRDTFHCGLEANWFSEAELKSPFIHGRKRESRTHADAVIGSFEFEEKTISGVKLPEDKNGFHCFYAIEAKIGSSLSKGVKADPNYNQASRYLGCLAYLACSHNITDYTNMGLIICVPSHHKSNISNEEFEEYCFIPLDTRITDYYKENPDDKFKTWWENNNKAFRKDIKIEILHWEDLVKGDDELSSFYTKCLKYSKK